MRTPIRIGAVSFLNTLPLIDGLEGLVGFDLRYSVPSRLIGQVIAGDIDVGLCSSIDYQAAGVPLVVLPVGLLGCAGPTLTVRLYAARPLETLDVVHCDTDSHTSVAMLRILLRERYDIDPELRPYDAHDPAPRAWPEALLLIGDKVITDAPPAERYPHQVDLGEAWFDWLGRPFVFAAWMALRSNDPERLAVAAEVLDRQRRHNAERIDGMIHRRVAARGWSSTLAREYLKERLVYDYTEETEAGMNLFFDKAAEHGLLETRAPLERLGEAPGVRRSGLPRDDAPVAVR